MMDAMHGMNGAADVDRGVSEMMGMCEAWGMGGMIGFGLLWQLIMVGLVTLLVLGAVWLWRRGGPGKDTPAPSARETLDRRYAAGELDRDTYLQIRSDLEISG